MAQLDDRPLVRDTLRFIELEKPPFRYTLGEAIGAGHLVTCRIYKAMTVKTAAEDRFAVSRDELDSSMMTPAVRAEFEHHFAESDSITVGPPALQRRSTIPERKRAIVRESRDCLEKRFT